MAPIRRDDDGDFEASVFRALVRQDQALERLESKLNAPVLNGGFKQLVEQVNRIELAQRDQASAQSQSIKQVEELHDAVMDPTEGLIVKVNAHTAWIDTASRCAKWTLCLGAAGTGALIGKAIWELLLLHVR